MFMSSIGDGKVTAPVRVSEEGFSSYAPSVAIARGWVNVAWHSFRDNNYDIYMKARHTIGFVQSPHQTWTREFRVTEAPTTDRHARLFSGGNKLWLLYENAQMGSEKRGYTIGNTRYRRLQLGCFVGAINAFDSKGVLAPEGSNENCPLSAKSEAPDAGVDAMGRLWVVYRQPNSARSWDVMATCFDGEKWQRARPISHLKGMDQRPTMALVNGRAVVAYQA